MSRKRIYMGVTISIQCIRAEEKSIFPPLCVPVFASLGDALLVIQMAKRETTHKLYTGKRLATFDSVRREGKRTLLHHYILVCAKVCSERKILWLRDFLRLLRVAAQKLHTHTKVEHCLILLQGVCVCVYFILPCALKHSYIRLCDFFMKSEKYPEREIASIFNAQFL